MIILPERTVWFKPVYQPPAYINQQNRALIVCWLSGLGGVRRKRGLTKERFSIDATFVAYLGMISLQLSDRRLK